MPAPAASPTSSHRRPGRRRRSGARDRTRTTEREPDRTEGGDADGGHREGHVRRPAGGAERDADRDAQRDVPEHRDGELGPAHLGRGPDGRGGAGFQGGHRWGILRSRWSTAAQGIQNLVPTCRGPVRPRVPPPMERGGGPVIHRNGHVPEPSPPSAARLVVLAEGRPGADGCDGAGRCASTSRRAGLGVPGRGVTPRGGRRTCWAGCGGPACRDWRGAQLLGCRRSTTSRSSAAGSSPRPSPGSRRCGPTGAPGSSRSRSRCSGSCCASPSTRSSPSGMPGSPASATSPATRRVTLLVDHYDADWTRAVVGPDRRDGRRARRRAPARTGARRARRQVPALPGRAPGRTGRDRHAPALERVVGPLTHPNMVIVAHPRRAARCHAVHMTDLDTLAPDFVEAAHTLVYCSVSTVDRAGRPRSRVMHPIWEWDGRRLTGWLASMPSPKMAHLAGRPYVSCAYHDGWAVAVVADSRIEPITDDAGRTHVWELFRAAPPPLGFDPGGDRRARLGRAHRAGVRGGPDGPVAGAGPPGPARRRGGAADVAGGRGPAVGASRGQPPALDGWLSPTPARTRPSTCCTRSPPA